MKCENSSDMIITPYIHEYKDAVIGLWQKCNLTRPLNNPESDIERKLRFNPELFLVGLIDGTVMASVMGGYDGHRGWIHYLAVDPNHQRKGYGQQIMNEIGKKLREKGCPKINLQVRADNNAVVKFYESIGYMPEDRVSMEKRLVDD